MTKDIMLLFLSTVTIDRDTATPRRTTYEGVGDCYTTNESAVRYLCAQGAIPARLFAFASTRVQNEPVGGKVTATHEEYFCERVRGVIPDIAARYVALPYDDRATVEASLACVIAMAERINSYIDTLPAGTKVTLHADFTGGMRHANTMMIALLRLLEYSGVNVGNILYSNYGAARVERINSIYDMFGLVAGATEFINYGSVKALEEYFPAAMRTAVLDRLLRAMHSFADEIKLCHAGRLLAATAELAAAMKAFDEREAASAITSERLMAQLASRIRRDYGTLLGAGDSRLKLIEWCLDHDYFQQALTLYVESVPEIMVASGIINITDAGYDAIRNLKAKNSPTNDAFFFLTEMRPNEKKTAELFVAVKEYMRPVEEKQQELVRFYQHTARELRKNPLAVEKVIARLYEFNASEPVALVDTPRAENMLRWLIGCRQDLQLLIDAPNSCSREYTAFMAAYSSQPGNSAETFVAMEPGKKLRTMLSFIMGNAKDDMLTAMFTCTKFEYAGHVCAYIDNGLATLGAGVTRERLRDILNTYGDFKTERNISNHARQDEDVITAAELQARMRAALATIREAIPERPPVVE